MRFNYDFHIHSCLSPCGDLEMTPQNIVNLAVLLELDIIALTDHNSCKNCGAVMRAGKAAGLAVIPGMELCTAEEVHVVCLFPGLDEAEDFAAEVSKGIPPIRNVPEIFGPQLIMDENDRVTGEVEPLLLSASSVPINEAPALVRRFGGFCYPSHIDRSSFSVLANLGGFPPEPGFTCAEISPFADAVSLRAAHPALCGVRFMRSSDAHALDEMRPAGDTLELPHRTAEAVIRALDKLTVDSRGRLPDAPWHS